MRRDVGHCRAGGQARRKPAGSHTNHPLTTIRDHVAGMDGQTSPPAPDTAYPRVLAANGPKMLALAGDIADGALPAGLPPEHTAQARHVLGPDKLLMVGLSVVADDEPIGTGFAPASTVASTSLQP